MKKVLSLIIVLTMVATLFAACGKEETPTTGGTTKETTATKEDTSSKVEEKEMVDFIIALNKMPEGVELKRALEEIQTLDKYSHVKFEVLPSQEEFNTSLPIVIAAGEQRDLVAIGNPIIQQSWADAGIIQPIDGAIASLGWDFAAEYGQFEKNAMNNGETFVIPHALTKWALYYNKSVFDAAGVDYPDPVVPMTWAEYTDIAAKLTTGEGSSKVYGTFHLTWPMFWYGEAIQKLGGGEAFYTADGLSNIEDPAFAAALERNYNMQHTDKSTQSQADLVSSKTTPTAFMNGQYGMTIAGGWIMSWATDGENHPRDWEIGLAPLPVDEGTTQKTWGIVNAFGVGATAADPELSVDVAMELSRLCAQYQEAQEEANRIVASPDVYVAIGDKLGAEGISTEVIKAIMANPDTMFVTEKVMGPNNVAYEQVIKEEVEKYFVQAQDLATTIENIKVRGDKAILDN